MERRKDRLLTFFKNNNKIIQTFRVFRAVDGKVLPPSQKIQRLFGPGDYKYRRGIVGCAYSHIKLWKELCTNFQKDYMIVLEDDVKLTVEFLPKALTLIHKYKFDIMFLHWNPHHIPVEAVQHEYRTAIPVAYEWSLEKAFSVNMGSTAAYIITKQGAYNLLQRLNEKGSINAIDWEMMKSAPSESQFNTSRFVNTVMVSSPMLAFVDKPADSDIQSEFVGCGMTPTESILYEIEWWKQHKQDVKEVSLLPIRINEVLMCSQSLKTEVEARSQREAFLWYLTGVKEEDKIVIVPWKLAPDDFIKMKTLGNDLVNMIEV
jgi:GR25 family glycosyltransferase involved in LPS biosynthesis